MGSSNISMKPLSPKTLRNVFTDEKRTPFYLDSTRNWTPMSRLELSAVIRVLLSISSGFLTTQLCCLCAVEERKTQTKKGKRTAEKGEPALCRRRSPLLFKIVRFPSLRIATMGWERLNIRALHPFSKVTRPAADLICSFRPLQGPKEITLFDAWGAFPFSIRCGANSR